MLPSFRQGGGGAEKKNSMTVPNIIAFSRQEDGYTSACVFV
jgi:hypothetical protein